MLPNRIVLIVVLLVYQTRTTLPLWRPYYDRYPLTITDRVRCYRSAYVIQNTPYQWYRSLSVCAIPMYLVIRTVCVAPLHGGTVLPNGTCPRYRLSSLSYSISILSQDSHPPSMMLDSHTLFSQIQITDQGLAVVNHQLGGYPHCSPASCGVTWEDSTGQNAPACTPKMMSHPPSILKLTRANILPWMHYPNLRWSR